MNKNRPVNLDISTIKLPITAYVSILHRVSGIVLLGGVLVLIWMLDLSLASESSFNELKATLSQPLVTFIVWAVLAALGYHSAMGVRHLIMDIGIGESLEGGRRGAWIAAAVAVILIISAAGWLLW